MLSIIGRFPKEISPSAGKACGTPEVNSSLYFRSSVYLDASLSESYGGSAATRKNERFSAVIDPSLTANSPGFFSSLPTVEGLVPYAISKDCGNRCENIG
jgi:hypothetical protein